MIVLVIGAFEFSIHTYIHPPQDPRIMSREDVADKRIREQTTLYRRRAVEFIIAWNFYDSVKLVPDQLQHPELIFRLVVVGCYIILAALTASIRKHWQNLSCEVGEEGWARGMVSYFEWCMTLIASGIGFQMGLAIQDGYLQPMKSIEGFQEFVWSWVIVLLLACGMGYIFHQVHEQIQADFIRVVNSVIRLKRLVKRWRMRDTATERATEMTPLSSKKFVSNV